MNIFYLDEDIDKSCEYHIDKHIVKMPTEVAQLLTSAVWVDKFLGFIPRKLEKPELDIINAAKQPEAAKDIESRTYTRFLPTHINHPCAIWVRSSFDNYAWAYSYCDGLNSEYTYRYGKGQDHKSFTAAQALPN